MDVNVEVVEALEQLEKEKGISKEVLLSAIEVALVSAFKRNYGSAQNVRVEIDPVGGNIRVLARKNVVEEVRDPRIEVSLAEAEALDPNYEVGDVIENEVTPREFGRIAAQTAKQVVVQKIREAERGIIFEEYSNREGEVVTGVVQRREQRNVVIDLGRVEAVMPPNEQTPGEPYNFGDRIKVYIAEVKKTPKGPQVIVSRTHPGLVKRLFELEVPEIYDGTVEIKGIAREAGMRSKIAVSSRDENVDAIGACVGPRGMRVQKVVNELRGEKIDIIAWDPVAENFVANALSPARVVNVRLGERTKTARVIVPDNQLSLAIGKEGQNARLAAKMTGWKIDIKSESQAAEMLFEPAHSIEDVEAESGIASGPETGTGLEAGPGAVQEPVAGPVPEPEPEPELEPRSMPGFEFESEPGLEPEPEPVFEPDPGPAPGLGFKPEPPAVEPALEPGTAPSESEVEQATSKKRKRGKKGGDDIDLLEDGVRKRKARARTKVRKLELDLDDEFDF